MTSALPMPLEAAEQQQQLEALELSPDEQEMFDKVILASLQGGATLTDATANAHRWLKDDRAKRAKTERLKQEIQLMRIETRAKELEERLAMLCRAKPRWFRFYTRFLFWYDCPYLACEVGCELLKNHEGRHAVLRFGGKKLLW